MAALHHPHVQDRLQVVPSASGILQMQVRMPHAWLGGHLLEWGAAWRKLHLQAGWKVFGACGICCSDAVCRRIPRRMGFLGQHPQLLMLLAAVQMHPSGTPLEALGMTPVEGLLLQTTPAVFWSEQMEQLHHPQRCFPQIGHGLLELNPA